VIEPQLILEADSASAGVRAASLVDEVIRTTPGAVLGLPTGSTPIPMYAALVRLHRETGTDWSGVTTFNLDEYLGIGPDHPESYDLFMRRHLFEGVNLPPERAHLPHGLAPDPVAEAERYERAIEAAGGLDLAVLGVGINGHIGFNEPAATLTARTHIATLDADTWRRSFPELAADPSLTDQADAPFRRAYTMGIGTILQAKRLLLVATGESKREIIRAALHGPVTTQLPASLLQLHRHVTIILDRAAAG
jgi:glucosamine-6-phosphate deaminase